MGKLMVFPAVIKHFNQIILPAIITFVSLSGKDSVNGIAILSLFMFQKQDKISTVSGFTRIPGPGAVLPNILVLEVKKNLFKV